MGYDLVTWSPRVGASGDDQWNWPGSVKLDGSAATDVPVRLVRGDQSGFSATPTIVQLNASSGLNQIVGLINRRAANYNTLYGGAVIAALPYFAENLRLTFASLNALAAKINDVRTREGFAAYTFPAVSGRFLGAWIAHFRKALRISGTVNLVHRHYRYIRIDNPYKTLVSETVNGWFTPVFSNQVGKLYELGPDIHRYRSMFFFPIHEWITGTGFTPTLGGYSGRHLSGAEGFDLRVYWNSKSVPPAAADFAGDGTLIQTIASADIPDMPSSSWFDWPIGASAVSAAAGSWKSVVCLSSWEYNQLGLSNVTARASVNDVAMSLDFGA